MKEEEQCVVHFIMSWIGEDANGGWQAVRGDTGHRPANK